MNLFFPISRGIAGCATEYSGFCGGGFFSSAHIGSGRLTTNQDYGKQIRGNGVMLILLFPYGCCPSTSWHVILLLGFYCRGI
jgi:hypothetical protein